MAENNRVLYPTGDWVRHHIVPDRLTHDLKRVLFVCVGGSGMSGTAMDLFKEASERQPLSAVIRMDTAGINDLADLRAKLAKTDFVVPMLPSLVPTIRKAMGDWKKKPKILNAEFERRSDIGNPAVYKRL